MVTSALEKFAASIFFPEDGGSKCVLNINNHDYKLQKTASYVYYLIIQNTESSVSIIIFGTPDYSHLH
jgi:hypothetical protein